MDYASLIKRLTLAPDFQPPEGLGFGDLRARPLARTDLAEDLDAVNSSIDLIKKTRGGDWPDGQIDEQFNLLDLAWHEREFRDNDSFAYAVHGAAGTYIGCFYLYPMGLRTELTEALADHDVDASWWVTADAYQRGLYEKLHAALVHWIEWDFPFEDPYFSNRQIPT